MDDVYSSPQEYGLVTLGEISLDDEPYQFCLFAAWGDRETGFIYYGTDSGCSCPSPFEDYKNPKADLAVAYSYDEFCNAVDRAVAGADVSMRTDAMVQGQRLKQAAREFFPRLFEAARRAVAVSG